MLRKIPYNIIDLLPFPFLGMLFISMLLPSSGSHHFFQIRSALFLSAAGVTVVHAFFCRALPLSLLRLFLIPIGFLTFLFFYLTRQFIIHGTEWSLFWDQAKMFLLTLGSAFMVIYWIRSEAVNISQVVLTLIVGNALYVVIKTGLIIGALLGFYDLFDLLERSGFSFITMSISDSIKRVQTSCDVPTPFLLLFVLQRKTFGLKIPRAAVFLLLLIMSFGIFISFSRFLWFSALCVALLHWTLLKEKFREKPHLTLLSILAGLVIGFFMMNQWLLPMLEKRFFDEQVWISDLSRIEQMEALYEEFALYPLFGKGLGCYSEECIRDLTTMYYYEVQWVAIMMQLGIIGCLPLFYMIAKTCLSYLAFPHTFRAFVFLTVYLLWIFSGFTNPFLLSLNSGLIYGLFYVTALYLRRQCRLHPSSPAFFPS